MPCEKKSEVINIIFEKPPWKILEQLTNRTESILVGAVDCVTTSRHPLPNQVLNRVWSRTSMSNMRYLLLSSTSSVAAYTLFLIFPSLLSAHLSFTNTFQKEVLTQHVTKPVTITFSGGFAILRKVTISFVMCVRTEQLSFHWKGFHEI